MTQNKKEKKPAKRLSKRETLQERVHRHLSDINSEITDDDIKGVQTELEIREDEKPDVSPQQGEEIDKQAKQTTTWNQLSEGYD